MVAIDDDSQKLKYTYQQVDDARIREADVHEAVRLKEIELELFKLQDETKQKKINLFALFIMIVIAISTPIIFRNKK